MSKYYNAMIRVAREYAQKGLFEEWSPNDCCYISKDRELQILATQRMLSTPEGVIEFPVGTSAAEIRKVINGELRKLASLKAMADAKQRTEDQGTLSV